MENLRIRRAGFAYRRVFSVFLERYKCLCKTTWPSWRGSAKEGARAIMESLRLPADYFRIGTSKVFLLCFPPFIHSFIPSLNWLNFFLVLFSPCE